MIKDINLRAVMAALAVTLLLISAACKETDDPILTDWQELGGANSSTIVGSIMQVVSGPEGNVYLEGETNLMSVVKVWDGYDWADLGDISSWPFTDGVHHPLHVDSDGNVYGMGMIKVPSANSEVHLAKYDKLAKDWFDLDPGLDNIHSIATDYGYKIFVSGNLYSPYNCALVKQWDGTSWTVLGDTLPYGDEIYLHVDCYGDLFATLGMPNANQSHHLERWTGKAWEELGGQDATDFGTGAILGIDHDAEGNLYVVGNWFKNGDMHYVARWSVNAEAWSFIDGIPHVNSAQGIAIDDWGDLYFVGDLRDDSERRQVAKWNGVEWTFHGNLNSNGSVRSVCTDYNGTVFIGGDFTNSNSFSYVAYRAR